MTTPAGWYPDPERDDGTQRWWDGERWTDHRAPGAAPAPPAAPPPPTFAPPGAGPTAGPTWDAPPPSAQPAYGTPGVPGGVAAAPRTNGKAIASLVLSILWFVGVGSIAAIVLGIIARREIRERGERGNGLAVSGIAIGALGILGAVMTLALVAFVASEGEDLVGGFDLTVVSQFQNAHRQEFGTYASNVDDLLRVDGADASAFDFDGDGNRDVRIVRADEDGFCAESTLSGEVRHIGEGGFVSSAGPCP